jgi:hypothetical protein
LFLEDLGDWVIDNFAYMLVSSVCFVVIWFVSCWE